MIKRTEFTLCVLAACSLGLLGCKKSEPAPPPNTIQQAGVTLDLPKLDTEFQNASPALRGAATQIKTLYYRGQLTQAVAELRRLSTNPGLTESQKKLVTDLTEQMKQAIAASASPGPQ